MDSASLRPEAADSFAVRAALLVDDGGNAHLKSLTAMKVQKRAHRIDICQEFSLENLTHEKDSTKVFYGI